jgi:transposase InsO family protein
MADHLRSELVLGALDMALTRRQPGSGLVHHSDHGTQGGFHRSSQHLETEVASDGRWQAGAGDPGIAWRDVVAGQAIGRAA